MAEQPEGPVTGSAERAVLEKQMEELETQALSLQSQRAAEIAHCRKVLHAA